MATTRCRKRFSLVGCRQIVSGITSSTPACCSIEKSIQAPTTCNANFQSYTSGQERAKAAIFEVCLLFTFKTFEPGLVPRQIDIHLLITHPHSLVINAVLMNLDKESLMKMELKIMYFRVLCLKNVKAQKLN